MFILILLVLTGIGFAQPFPEVLFDRSGQGPQSHYGISLFSLGDQNDDGFMDWGVAAAYGFAGQPSESMTEFFYGGDPPSGEPYMVFTADPVSMIDLGVVVPLGDVNGDGYIDWATDYRYRPDYGTVWYEVYWGGPEPSTEPVATFLMPVSDQNLLGMGGDFNGDGFDDLYSYNGRQNSALVYWGSEQLDTIPDLRFDQRPGGGYAYGIGDLNGDGLVDIMATVPPSWNLLHIFFGSAEPDTIPDVIWEDFFASEPSVVNDLNGDGRDDLAMGYVETIDIHSGGGTISQIPTTILNFAGCSNDAVTDISSIGDFNHDGYGDFAAFSWQCANGHGKMAMYLGHRWMNLDPVLEIVGRTAPLYLVGPWTGAALGDVNGDHIDDFAIGAWNTSTDGGPGRCVVLAGDTSYVVSADPTTPTIPNDFSLSAYPNPFNSEATIEMEVAHQFGAVELTIFNTLGQVVHHQCLPVMGLKMKYRWDGKDISSGIYFVTAAVGETRKVVKVAAVK